MARPAAVPAASSKELQALAAIGYASGQRAPSGHAGVTVFETDHAQDGLNLCIFGHEAAAVLMDMRGEVVHRWALDLEPHLEPGERLHHKSWRRVHVLGDGSLLGIHEGQYLVKVDRDSRPLWIFRGGAHHDLDVAKDGSILVLTRKAHVVPRRHLTRPCLEDFISRLDAEGHELQRLSILEAIEASPYAPLLEHMAPYGDITHTNTIEILDGRWEHRSPAFKADNLLVSIRELDTIAIIDPVAGEVVWALTGMWNAQHQPTFLEDGQMLVFDNLGHFGLSRVLEFDPLTQQVSWMYTGTPEAPFFSEECGSCQRLPNGNTLITETNPGRAFEVTAAGRIVWEYLSPFHAGDEGQYVASLFEMIRLPADFGSAWRRPR